MRTRLARILAGTLLLAACTGVDPGASGSGAPSPSGSRTEEAPTDAASAGESGGPGDATTNTNSPRPAASTPQGDLEPASPERRKTASPVPVDESARTGTGVRVSLLSWDAVTIKSGAPGEIGGPGVAITVRVVNGSPSSIDLSNVVVDLRTGKQQTPVIRSDRAPTAPFSGTLGAGERSSATYAFRVDKGDRDKATLLVSLSPEVPVVVFEGSLG